jgi:hypothetical protein
MLNREPIWNENPGFLLVSFAIASAAAILVPAAGFGGLPGALVVIVVFIITFLICMLAVDRLFLQGGNYVE